MFCVSVKIRRKKMRSCLLQILQLTFFVRSLWICNSWNCNAVRIASPLTKKNSKVYLFVDGKNLVKCKPADFYMRALKKKKDKQHAIPWQILLWGFGVLYYSHQINKMECTSKKRIFLKNEEMHRKTLSK